MVTPCSCASCSSCSRRAGWRAATYRPAFALRSATASRCSRPRRSTAAAACSRPTVAVGRTFGMTLAAEVADVTAGAFEEAIAEAAAGDVVSLVEPGRYRFSHALVAETLASTLTPPLRAKL